MKVMEENYEFENGNLVKYIGDLFVVKSNNNGLFEIETFNSEPYVFVRGLIEPLPVSLSPEILMIMGFEPSGDDGYNTYWEKNSVIIADGKDGFFLDKGRVRVEYFHQVQNLNKGINLIK